MLLFRCYHFQITCNFNPNFVKAGGVDSPSLSVLNSNRLSVCDSGAPVCERSY
jgi:hypothetical protein